MQNQRIAIGFSDHSGWAVMAVVVRSDAEKFELLSRERIQTCPPHLPRQPFHAVAERDFPQDVVTEVFGEAFDLSIRAMEVAMISAPIPIQAAAVAIGRLALSDPPLEIPEILKSHARLHAAEGEIYRDALSYAAAYLGLRVVRFMHHEVRSEAAAALVWSLGELEAELGRIGKSAGRPWTKDEKDATAAAILALSTAGSP